MAVANVLAVPTVTLPLFDDFEGYAPETPLIDGINGWYGSGTNVMVQTNFFYTNGLSTQAAQVPLDSFLSNRFELIDPPASLWMEMFVQPVHYTGTNDPVCETNVASVFFLNSNGYFVLCDTTNNWVVASNSVTVPDEPLPPVQTGDWVQLDCWLNYNTKTWSFFLNGDLIRENLNFADPNVEKLNSVDVYNGSGPTTFVDNVQVSVEVPEGLKTNQHGGWITVLAVSQTNFALPDIAHLQSYTNTETFDVWHAGGMNDLYFTNTVIAGETWLSVDPADGFSTGVADRQTVTLSFSTAGLTPNTYTGRVLVAGFDAVYGTPASNSPQVVEVVLTVNPRASVAVGTNALRVTTREGVNGTANLPVWNGSGYYTLDFTSSVATVSGGDWLSVAPVTGSSTGVSNQVALTITCNAATVATNRGVYTGSVTIAGTMSSLGEELVADDSPQVIEVVMEVTYPPPSLAVTPVSLRQQVARGGNATNDILSVWNGNGLYTLVFNVSESIPWLAVSPAGGTSTGPTVPVTVAYDVSSFAVGAYTGVITIAGTDQKYGEPSENTPVDIPVLIEIFDPPAPLWVSATDGVYTNKVRVQWRAVEDSATNEVWRGVAANVAEAQRIGMAAGTATVYDDIAAVPGKVYYYWVRGVNQYGAPGGYSPNDTGYQRLVPPPAISATRNDFDDRVRVSWNVAEGVPTGYEVWRNVSGGTGVLLGASSALWFDDATASPGVLYYYWVKATNAACRSIAGPFAEGWRRLPAPASLVASQGTITDRVSVNWTAVSGAAHYELWRNGARVTTLTALNYTDSDVAHGVGYNYSVRAMSTVSTGTQSAAVAGWLGLTTTPSMRASAGLYTYKIGLNWDAVSGAGSYQVQRSARSDFVDYDVLGATAGVTYDDTTATPGLEYYYRVRAVQGDLGWLSSVGAGWRRLSPPTWLAASQGTYPGGIRLTWEAVAGSDLYEVWSAAENDAFGAVRVGDVAAADQPEFVDGTVGPGATRYYWVKSRSAVGVSDLSFNARGYAPLTGVLGGTDYVPVPDDYDGDGKGDPAVYADALGGIWRAMLSGSGYAEVHVANWGAAGWLPVPGDYDGDGKADPAVYLPDSGAWRIWLSGSGYTSRYLAGWGGASCTPVAGDYDGDGLCDPAVYCGATAVWRWWGSASGYAATAKSGFGGAGWASADGDYDGDGRADPAVYREADGAWWVRLSGAGYSQTSVSGWGGAGWTPVPGDYDGDGLTDPAVYNEAAGAWRIWFSGSGYRLQSIDFGGTGYAAAPLDFHGAGRLNLCVYHRTSGLWWVRPW